MTTGKAKKMKRKSKNPLEVFHSAITSGNLVKSWRANFEIPQEDMAFACGISQANLSAIENGRREVGPRVALRLAAYMGISPEIILYPNGIDAEPEFKEVQKRAAKLKGIAV
jgi:transcriptional regulator with XRE-family HTH domain